MSQLTTLIAGVAQAGGQTARPSSLLPAAAPLQAEGVVDSSVTDNNISSVAIANGIFSSLIATKGDAALQANIAEIKVAIKTDLSKILSFLQNKTEISQSDIVALQKVLQKANVTEGFTAEDIYSAMSEFGFDAAEVKNDAAVTLNAIVTPLVSIDNSQSAMQEALVTDGVIGGQNTTNTQNTPNIITTTQDAQVIKNNSISEQPLQDIMSRMQNVIASGESANKATENTKNVIATSEITKADISSILNSAAKVLGEGKIKSSKEVVKKSTVIQADTTPVKENKLASLARKIGLDSPSTENTLNIKGAANSDVNTKTEITRPLLTPANEMVFANVKDGVTTNAGQNNQDTSNIQNIANVADNKISSDVKLANITSANTTSTHVASSPADQVRVQLTSALKQGEGKISVQLDPANLGKVDVHIELNAHGKAHVVVMAEKSETLDMLQKDARTLEKALHDAGVKTDSGSMNFNLRNGSGNAMAHGERNTHKTGAYKNSVNAEIDNLAQIEAVGKTYVSNRALDIIA